MSRIEYYNPNPYKVVVVSSNGVRTVVNGYKRAVIDNAVTIEPANSLKVIRTLPENKQHKVVKPVQKTKQRVTIQKIDAKSKGMRSAKSHIINKDENVLKSEPKHKRSVHSRNARVAVKRKHKDIVGMRVASGENASANYKQYIQRNNVTISKNIAIGVLSYNRLHAIKRLLYSIRTHTNLNNVVLFISDESSDAGVKSFLKNEAVDFVYLDNTEQLGVAGNSNRLLKCMSRFKYCFLLNDDVEILNDNWIDAYINASTKTGISHFCFRQPGLIGAGVNDGIEIVKNDVSVQKIDSKPHGAMLFYTNNAFAKVGYFDESWGEYGMEHVDWSNRISLSGIQENGYYDIRDSYNLVKIHNEPSAASRTNLKSARIEFNKVKDDNTRIFINHSDKISLPSISYVIPIRNIGRSASINTVINNIRGQLFPVIDIVVVEEDHTQQFHKASCDPISYKFLRCVNGRSFNKSKAFNTGVLNTKYDNLVLHDADILVQSKYTERVFNLLKQNNGVHIGKEVMYFTEDYTKTVNEQYTVNGNGKCHHQVGYFEGGSIACNKQTYFKIGGFNDDFEGYGCEDCDFFKRLLDLSNPFYNERTEIFYHLHHGRVAGWEACHKRNKELIKKFYSMNRNEYISILKIKLNKYGA